MNMNYICIYIYINEIINCWKGLILSVQSHRIVVVISWTQQMIAYWTCFWSHPAEWIFHKLKIWSHIVSKNKGVNAMAWSTIRIHLTLADLFPTTKANWHILLDFHFVCFEKPFKCRPCLENMARSNIIHFGDSPKGRPKPVLAVTPTSRSKNQTLELKQQNYMLIYSTIKYMFWSNIWFNI